jgi:predicted phage terminase large subunit-like protein
MCPLHLSQAAWFEKPDRDPVASLADQLVDQICQHSPAARGYVRPGVPRDLLGWGRQFLPAYFRFPPSKMHAWLAVELERLERERGGRLNILAPRGGAKSTLATFCYALRAAVEGREPYIWIVSATREQARTHLRHLRAELEANPQLARAYPRATGRGPSWRAGSVQLSSGIAIEAFGMGQQLRGRRLRQHRPSLILCDDVENDIHVASPAQRAACREWFHGVVLKAGDERTNVVNLATALHRDALSMHLHRSAGWTSATFCAIQRWPDNMELWRQWEEVHCNPDDPRAAQTAREFYAARREAMDAGADLLWPEKEGLYALMQMRADEGRTTFEREKQNSPIDPERCEWPGEYFDHHIWFSDWPKNLAVRVVALDPSKGADARHGDYSAYVLLGVDPHGILYVEADLARRPTPDMVEQGVVLCRRFVPERLVIETNQYQELLAAEFPAAFRRLRRRSVPVHKLENHVNKLVRIRRLGSLLSQRRLRFLVRSPSTHLLVEQLRDFPLGDHDDGPDALEMAIRVAGELREGIVDDGLGDNLLIRH